MEDRSSVAELRIPPEVLKIAKRLETTLWFEGSLPDELLIQR